jgi:hypothetical protein
MPNRNFNTNLEDQHNFESKINNEHGFVSRIISNRFFEIIVDN